MQVNDVTVAGVPVLQISGSLSDPHGFKELQALVQRHLEQRCRRLVVELQDVSGLDAMGLTTLLAVLTHAGPDSRVIRVAQVGVDDLPLPRRLVVEYDDGGDVHPGGPAGRPLISGPDTTAAAIA
jgi:anti-anti-sigma regulatory factor